MNLGLQNDALLMKQLHKFYNREDLPWVQLIWSKYYTSKVLHAAREVGSFWWKDILRLNVVYRGFARCTIGDGSIVCFWDDLWSDSVLSIQFPRLASFAHDISNSVLDVMQEQDLDSIFLLPLSQEAFEELEHLQSQLMSTPFDPQQKDH